MLEIDKLIPIAIKAAVLAGKEIMRVYESKDFETAYKEDNSPLTLADRNAHLAIIDILNETNLPVLSEEGKHLEYKIRKTWAYFWLVDPLDGTKEFIKRNGEFTVNIALIKNDTPIAGIIYVPVSNTLYFADIKSGAYKVEHLTASEFDFENIKTNALRLPLSNTGRHFTVVGSRSHLSVDTMNFIEKLKEKHGNIEFMSVGSSLKQCMIAEGKADIYPRFGPTMEWDTGAGHAIVMAAGGSISQLDGSDLVYNKENLLNPDFIVKSK